jgi:hypothetical protein
MVVGGGCTNGDFEQNLIATTALGQYNVTSVA